MKKFRAFFLLLVFALPLHAVEDDQVMYTGGTVPALKEGSVGRFDTTSPSTLTFEYSGTKLVVPYARIVSFEYSQDVARHLGILPAIAVGLVRKRQRRHFFRISYRDDSEATQIVVFQVSKTMPRTLLPILQLRAPQACKSSDWAVCGRYPAQ
jgi:hypothetical protein